MDSKEPSLFPNDPRCFQGKFKEKFVTRYDFLQHENLDRIDAEELSLSTLGLSKSLKKIASVTLNTDVRLNICCYKPGCFDVVCEIVGFIGGMLSILQWFGYDYKKTKNVISGFLLHIFSIVCNDIKSENGFWLMNDGKGASDEEKLIFDKLLSDFMLRKQLDDFTHILSNGTISEVSINQDGTKLVSISKKERHKFIVNYDENKQIRYAEKRVTLVYLSPIIATWKFKTGHSEFWAEVQDDDFINTARSQGIKELAGIVYLATITEIKTYKSGSKRASVKRIITSIKLEYNSL